MTEGYSRYGTYVREESWNSVVRRQTAVKEDEEETSYRVFLVIELGRSDTRWWDVEGGKMKERIAKVVQLDVTRE